MSVIYIYIYIYIYMQRKKSKTLHKFWSLIDENKRNNG